MGFLQSTRTWPGAGRRPRWITAVAALAALALIAAACGADDTTPPNAAGESSTTSAAPATDAENESSQPVVEDDDGSADDTEDDDDADVATQPRIDHPVADISWVACDTIECGTLDVPLDYRVAGGETISIAINRVAASGDRIGVLFVNPGGPGAPGTDLADAFAFGAFPADLTDRFDIIGFDPRGTGDSEPAFACGASGEQLEILSAVEDIIDEPDEEEAVEAAVQLCVDSMGDAAGLIDTGSVVQDMNEIRRALGEEQISYLGYSYGSTIGTWYATLFPDTVRAMVIDGADNPIDDISDFDARLESTREQIGPIEDLLDEALSACGDSTCPIFNGGDPQGFYLDTVEKFPLITEASANNPDAGFLGLITPLYNEAQWPVLWDALADLSERDDPAAFVELSEFQLGTDPGAVNITGYINCLDGWALQPENDREARQASSAEFFAIEEELIAEFPLIGAIDEGLASTCSYLDVLDTPVLGVPYDGGGAPILVVGNTSDPVTSFGESLELVEETLTNGFLVEVDHGSHTVYPANPCVNEAVHAVLLDVSYPDERIVCERADTDVEAILIGACEAVAPQVNPGLSGDSLADACQRFADASIARLGEDGAQAALEGVDEDGANTLFTILQEEALSPGG